MTSFYIGSSTFCFPSAVSASDICLRCDTAAGCSNDDAPEPRRERRRADEDLDGPVARAAVVHAEGRAAAGLEEDAGEDGAGDGGDALEGGGAGVGDVRVLGLAARAVDRGVGPDGGEAAALGRTGARVRRCDERRDGGGLTSAPKTIAKGYTSAGPRAKPQRRKAARALPRELKNMTHGYATRSVR